MAEKESESEGETIETGWSVSTSRVLIQFYSENPLLWDKNHKEYGKKNIITKTLKPLLAMLGKSRAPNTEEAVKKRWPGLTSTTIRNLKKPVECKWVFWEDLRFLRDHMSVVTAEDDENSGEWSVQDKGEPVGLCSVSNFPKRIPANPQSTKIWRCLEIFAL